MALSASPTTAASTADTLVRKISSIQVMRSPSSYRGDVEKGTAEVPTEEGFKEQVAVPHPNVATVVPDAVLVDLSTTRKVLLGIAMTLTYALAVRNPLQVIMRSDHTYTGVGRCVDSCDPGHPQSCKRSEHHRASSAMGAQSASLDPMVYLC